MAAKKKSGDEVTAKKPLQLLPEPTKEQSADAAQIAKDLGYAPPQIGQTVNVLVGNGKLAGQIRPATVTEVHTLKDLEAGEEKTLGYNIDADVQHSLDADNHDDLPVVRNAPYVSAARLQIKPRGNTWHWPQSQEQGAQSEEDTDSPED